jgi:hypothetical protein
LGLGSDPLTIAPPSSSIRAKPLIPQPPMPMKCTRLPQKRLTERDSIRDFDNTDSIISSSYIPTEKDQAAESFLSRKICAHSRELFARQSSDSL